MSKLEIEGKARVSGGIKVSGAKNEALKAIALSLVLRGKVLLKNIPLISDALNLLKVIESIGAEYEISANDVLIDTGQVETSTIESPVVGNLRASIVLAGPLLARFGRFSSLLPGGCVIGARSIETHLDAFKQLGAEVKISDDKRLTINLPKPTKNKIILKEKSVTATENAILYASAVGSEITIENCAVEPEIIELTKVIRSAGAEVRWGEDREVKIKGSQNLSINEIEIMPDMIEAGTFAILFVATGGEGTVYPFPKEELKAFLEVMKESGANIEIKNDKAIIKKSEKIKPISITTEVYPGFPTDLQAPMALIAAIADGVSTINETLYENRLGHLAELEKMGLKVEIIDKHKAQITGPAKLSPTTIRSYDLRAGITLLIAAIMAEGKTVIENAELIDRGYENIDQKISQLGVKLKRID